MIKYFFGLSLLAGLLLSSCSKSTIIGSEILENDFVNVSFSDTSTLKVMNLPADTFRTYPLSSSVFLLGQIDDPLFGKTSTEIYTQIRKMFEIPDLENTTLDSVILSLSLNSSVIWGDTLSNHNVEVYELGESLESYDSIYSNQQFSRAMLLGSKTFNPNSQDTAAFNVEGDTIYLSSTSRIPLDLGFGEKLFYDTIALNNDTLLRELTPGLVLKSSPETTGVFGINNGTYVDESTNKIIFYYTKDDSLRLSHSITLGGKRSVYVEHDRSSAGISNYFNNPQASDTLLFVSGLKNSHISIDIPYLDGLEDVLINYAELEFYTANPEEQLPYDKIEQFYLYNQGDDGSISYTDDLNISILYNLTEYFDASIKEEELESGLLINKYNINVTNELKKRIKEGDVETSMILVPFQSASRANRSVLFGPGHSQYPAKLKITYTKQN